jgi:hypothetical protein
MNSASLYSLAGRYDNPIPTRFLAPIVCFKIPALSIKRFYHAGTKEGGKGVHIVKICGINYHIFRKACMYHTSIKKGQGVLIVKNCGINYHIFRKGCMYHSPYINKEGEGGAHRKELRNKLPYFQQAWMYHASRKAFNDSH